ncbi:immunoglobulin-binding protein 1b [Cricetulus griseus]|uniref:immunoglobulin-binding protein 1b n=1 Tax=Cricetulus griseus TaxID=10029 RepID=UPI000228D9C1|nr:immunoglobulin-binding protein 1b [Cricetulus griseus]XP_007647941.1 immunoglobulin-binding protein 1b [Cricetulus griseus]XP_007647942.1 immunoglobulin-binding protein 1b [Cricetulus griseus]XP_016834521.1 immunoglobulin-binding protein 1b [Cricetulus griseus]XP_027289783.1 immunoglobulin-binding protein 1b [Cricetulus griseus]XP_027289784.1 immunoglobulin-binding protein 1b [Cricetulus griseus]XP_027289785.1 immunoglobulin-binding protein 1b [Cricetulus griseus]XP_027289787.1 immunoglob
MTTSEEELQQLRLPDLLETGRQLLEEVEASTQPTGSKPMQDKVRRALELLEKASDMLSELDPFSQNEDWEEIASPDLKYLMLPALKGALTLNLVGNKDRFDYLLEAREHFKNFLTQSHNYHVADFELPWEQSSSPECNPTTSEFLEPTLFAMASQRQAKIDRYKQNKAVEQKLSTLKSAVESGQADEECVREYNLLQLRRWINISLDEMDRIDQEIEILRERDYYSGETSASRVPFQKRPSRRPFILTRSAAQAQIFGAGYPSMATMTVNDWYEQHQKCTDLPSGQEVEKEASPPESHRASQKEEKEQEQKEEEEDEDARHRMQQWDDWKDAHPRGYGNRQNMG